jgi:hypothetical protein
MFDARRGQREPERLGDDLGNNDNLLHTPSGGYVAAEFVVRWLRLRQVRFGL